MRKEPAGDELSSFLDPLISELTFLWRGTDINIGGTGHKMKVALMCLACDVPASRKIGGFYSHAATLGCNKCYAEFKSSSEIKHDCSGFETETWTKRTHQKHLKHIEEIRRAPDSQKVKIEKKYGIRDSPLLKLSYFDAIEFNVIDPMHNLFLGVAKTCWRVWCSQKLLTEKDQQTVSDRLDELMTSHTGDCLPTEIKTNWGPWTANNWKIFTLCASTYCLAGVLPEEHQKYWQHFVKACMRLCRREILSEDAEQANSDLIQAFKGFEKYNGKGTVTPNMHLACHLKDCISNFGPIYSFWLFSFERYNGLIANIATNKARIEVQFMQKFVQSCHLMKNKEHLPEEFKNYFEAILPKETENNIESIRLPATYKISIFDEDDMKLISQSDQHYNLPNPNYKRFKFVHISQEKFHSKYSLRGRFQTLTMVNIDGDLKPCEIVFFFCHFDDDTPFACVSWFQECPSHEQEPLLEPYKKWLDRKKPRDHTCIIPVSKIKTHAVFKLRGNYVLLICPTNRKYSND